MDGMSCPHCAGIPRVFTSRVARRELRTYWRHGPRLTTQWILDALGGHGITDRTLVDVGGGVGVLQHEFIRQGGAGVVGVDAAPDYLEICRAEATRRGYHESAKYIGGDLVEKIEQVPYADYVTLDRVPCCYPDPVALLGAAATRARRAVAMVWPRDRRLARIGMGLGNFWMKATRNAFRAYVHSDAVVTDALQARGFRRTLHRTTTMWQMALFERGTGETVKAS